VHFYISCKKRAYTSGKPKAKEQPSVSYQDVEGESAGNLGGGSGKTDSDKGSDCSIAIANLQGDAQNLGGDSGKLQEDSMQTLCYTAFTAGEFWTGSDANLDPGSENSNGSISKFFLTEAAPLTAAKEIVMSYGDIGSVHGNLSSATGHGGSLSVANAAQEVETDTSVRRQGGASCCSIICQYVWR
jgi:hypothetical protein